MPEAMMPNIWGAGKLFCFSGLDGPTSWACNLMGSGSVRPFGIILRLYPDVLLRFGGDLLGKTGVLVLGDCADVYADTTQGDGRVRLAYADCWRLVGEVSGSLTVSLEGDWESEKRAVALETQPVAGGTRWCVGLSPHSLQEARARAASGLDEDLDALIAQRSAFVRSLDVSGLCADADERLFRKCAEVLKLNARAPEGQIGRRWTTPDVWPHRHMWLWDSAFHALGWAELDGSMAQDAILAVIELQQPDGKIDLCEAPEPQHQRHTQPPVLAWAAWRVFEKTGDREFLRACFAPLVRFLDWLFRERDVNGNGLLEWLKEVQVERCRCGESGWDNSPRFDRELIDDHVDLNAMVVRELQTLARMAEVLGEDPEPLRERAQKLAALVNERLWHPGLGLYLDRGPGDDPAEWMMLKSGACFLPMMAQIPDHGQALRLVDHLTDPEEFWLPVPVPTVAADEPQFSDDMWRGPTWMNINYLIWEGLRNYGFDNIADELRRRSMAAIAKWYYEGEAVFEYYDPYDRTHPFELHRKGGRAGVGGIGVIRDYGWTAAMYIAWARSE